jgi:hypothetical protein
MPIIIQDITKVLALKSMPMNPQVYGFSIFSPLSFNYFDST